MRRKIEDKLLFWLKNRKQALLLTGPRQVGKSYSILKFVNENFLNYIHIDFSKRPDLIDLFVSFNNVDELFLKLSAVEGAKLIPYKTAIFFDEIQLVYKRRDELISQGKISSVSLDLITAMKGTDNKDDYRFILSGSMLGVSLKNILLNPTGYLDEYKMYPMDFEEFLWAKGVGESVIDYVRKCFIEKEIVEEEINKVFLKYFKEYVLIGGMPEAVESFIEKNNLFNVQETLNQIYDRYLIDITTYINEEGLKLRVKDIFKAIPSQLSSKNTRYISSQVIDKKYLKHQNIEEEFLWLKAAGVAIPTFHVNEPVVPLILSSERKTMKLFMSDVGLLVSRLVDTGIREKLLNNEQVINYGAPYENAVAQELICHGFDDELFYYNSKSHGEVDFLITSNSEVVPIEVKSGKMQEKHFYNHSALTNLLKIYNYPKAYVFGETNVYKETNNIYQLPIYMIAFVTK